ncbi:dTDP-glucose 4,6-dehydratase [Kiloniella sp.]|uniref:dTDP-glucose 4,6-dehydratase n=1 Tax=Kiloniella sp. TaxID=1938587 RepID=UPI003B01189C
MTGVSNFWRDRSVLITGGAGFIGSEIVRSLAKLKPSRIVILDKMTYAADTRRLEGLGNSVQLEKVALEDLEAVQAAVFKAKPDCIIHCAAESHVDRSIDGPACFVQSNVVGTFNILQASLDYWAERGKDDGFRFLHISTDEVYGSLGQEGLFTEESAYSPRSPYSATKAASDHLVRAWVHTYGFPGIITNCGNNYGPWQFPEKLIPLMILAARDQRPLPIYGNGDQVREWIHVSDHVRGLLAVIEKGTVGDTYLIGSGEEKTNREVVETICQLMDRRFPDSPFHDLLIANVEDRPGHDQRYALDTSKIKRETGWCSQISFEEGLSRTLDWYLDMEPWWRTLQPKLNTGERLGSLKR